VTDTLPDSIYNYPVTIRRPLPSNWSSVSLIQSRKNIDAQIVVENGTKYLMFDVIPDKGDVVMRKSTTTVVSGMGSALPTRSTLMQNYPNPFNPSTVIRYSLNRTEEITLSIYNIFGQELATLVHGYQTAGEHEIVWQPESLPSGIYFCQLRTVSGRETKQLALVR
jgi:hypothetical protein